MKRKVYYIRIEQLQEVYKCMTQDDASIICQGHYQLVDSLPHFCSLTNNKPVIYWVESKEFKMTNCLNQLDSFEYVQLTASDILLKSVKSVKSVKGYYIKVEDILELNKTIPFSVIDDHLSYFGLTQSIKRVANKNQYFYWVKGIGLLGTKDYKPSKEFAQLTVEDILKLHSQRYENRLQKQKADVVRGDDTEGNRVQSRKRKATVTVGHLSYQAVKG